jgi:hypothetical protein
MCQWRSKNVEFWRRIFPLPKKCFSAAWKRRRGDMLMRGSKCGSIALTATQTGHFCRQICADLHRRQQLAGVLVGVLVGWLFWRRRAVLSPVAALPP